MVLAYRHYIQSNNNDRFETHYGVATYCGINVNCGCVANRCDDVYRCDGVCRCDGVYRCDDAYRRDNACVVSTMLSNPTNTNVINGYPANGHIIPNRNIIREIIVPVTIRKYNFVVWHVNK